MYPKAFWKSKAFWLGTAQYLLNGAQLISLITTGNMLGLTATQTAVLLIAENALLGIGHVILRFYTNQPIIPQLTN